MSAVFSQGKGQGLPITTIIVAAIGLIVLVIMISMVYQKTQGFGRGVRKVAENVCEPPNQKALFGTSCELIYANFKDLGPDEICCKKGTIKE